MPELATIEQLIADVLQIIPAFTSGRGSFSTVPQLGYKARNPGDWQREFLRMLDGRHLSVLKPDTFDILGLISLMNYSTLGAGPPKALAPDGSEYRIPTETLSTVLGYALLEMLARRLRKPRVPQDRGPSQLSKLLRNLEETTPLLDLGADLAHLNAAMSYTERGRRLDLYQRLELGRNLLMHGNVLRMMEPEGWLLVLLVDLIVLHAMRDEVVHSGSVD